MGEGGGGDWLVKVERLLVVELKLNCHNIKIGAFFRL